MKLLEKEVNLMEREILINRCRDLALSMMRKQKALKAMELELKESKHEFTNVAERAFEKCDIQDSIEFTYPGISNRDVGRIKVSRVVRTKVDFDAEAVEWALGKDKASKVVKKSYTINDMSGLVRYLKSCDVDPNIFKKFLSVEKSVNTEELERMEQLGEISMEDLDGCYTVTKGNPYFRVSAKKG